MQHKLKLLLCVAVFLIASIYFASNSNAFNTFKSTQEESKNLNESNNAIRELRDVNIQILEQLKLMNQQLSNLGGIATPMQNATPQNLNNAPPGLIRANP